MPIPPLSDADLESLAAPGLTAAKAELLCRHAIYAYFDGDKLSTVLEPVSWDRHRSWDQQENQGHVCWNKDCILVAFRGTDSKEDWQQNSKALWPQRHALGGKTHRGFVAVSEQAKSIVFETLQDLGGGKRRVLITGHSLGGAVATEFAASLHADPAPWAEDVEVVTFGAPRLGDERFESAYEQRAGGMHWWFVNSGDPVPHLPPNAMGYRHCGRLFWFNRSGRLVPVGEREVGLQADAAPEDLREAIVEYNELEKSVPHFQNENEYAAFLESIAETAGSMIDGIEVAGDGQMTIKLDQGELQGRMGDWLARYHRLGLYHDRVRAMLR